jgi:hypothetical protein
MTVPPTDLNFLKEDLRRQREIAEEGLREAKKNDLALGATQDPKAKELLENAKETFINIARGLAAKT